MALWTPLIMYDINEQWSFMISDHVDHVWNLLIMLWYAIDHAWYLLIMLWKAVDHAWNLLIMLWKAVDHTWWSMIIAMKDCLSFMININRCIISWPLSGHLVIRSMWSYGHLVTWSSGHQVNMVLWSSGHMFIWSSGQYGHSGHLVTLSIWSSGQCGQCGYLVI